MRNLAILLFNDVEVLDFCGPFEVFSVTNELNDNRLLRVFTVAETVQTTRTRNGLKVIPDFGLNDCPQPHILLIPGGQGTRSVMQNAKVTSWIRNVESSAELILTVCTGSLVLAKTGLLDGLKATTHHEVIPLLREIAPKTEVRPDKRIVDNGRIIISAGISAGIDMCLYVVGKLYGRGIARKTAEYMEYDWRKSLEGESCFS